MCRAQLDGLRWLPEEVMFTASDAPGAPPFNSDRRGETRTVGRIAAVDAGRRVVGLFDALVNRLLTDWAPRRSVRARR